MKRGQRQPGDCSRGKTKELQILLLTIQLLKLLFSPLFDHNQKGGGGGEDHSKRVPKKVKAKNKNKSENVLHSPLDHSQVNHKQQTSHTHLTLSLQDDT